jgi:hypothetical protein
MIAGHRQLITIISNTLPSRISSSRSSSWTRNLRIPFVIRSEEARLLSNYEQIAEVKKKIFETKNQEKAWDPSLQKLIYSGMFGFSLAVRIIHLTMVAF